MKDQSALDMTLEFFGTFLERNQNMEACQTKLQTAIDNITAQPDRVDEADNRNMLKSYDELPATLNASDISSTLGISRAHAYELMHSEGFPTIFINKRMIVAKDKFLVWMDMQVPTKFRSTMYN